MNHQAVISTPFSMVGIRCDADMLTNIDFLPMNISPKPPETLFTEEVVRQFRCYLADPAFHFSLPLARRGTEFQRRVWDALAEIPPSQVLTYGQLAKRLGTSPRPVGGALRANPLPIVIPCHRVVATGGGLGGYCGATLGEALRAKHWLLRHEGAVAGPP
jgi:methylated-DNA-[protein]-cysteine S-methyltransferase